MTHRLSRRSLATVVARPPRSHWRACSTGGGSSTDKGDGEGPVPEPTSPVTISFVSWVGNQPDMKKFARQFQKEHPNITIKFENVPAEQADQMLTTQIAGNNPPDVAFVNASDTADYASREALVDLDDYIERSDIVKPDDYVEAFKTFVTYEDKHVGPADGRRDDRPLLPHRPVRGGRHRRPADDVGEFEADAAALTDERSSQYGYELFATEAAYYWYPWLYQAGGDLLTRTARRSLFTSDEAKEAADSTSDLADYSPPDYLNSNSYDGRVAFAEGQVGMYMAGAWFAGTLADEFPDIDGKWATAPLPEGPAGCKTTIAGDALIMLQPDREPGRRLAVDGVPLPARDPGRAGPTRPRAPCCRR